MICKECVCCLRWSRPGLTDSLWGYFRKNPFVRKGPHLTFICTEQILLPIDGTLFSESASEFLGSICVFPGCVCVSVSPSSLHLSSTLAFMLCWTLYSSGSAPSWVRFLLRTLLKREKRGTGNTFLFHNNRVLFSLTQAKPASKLQRRCLSVIWGSGCAAVFPWSDDKKTGWYLCKTLWL